MPKRRCWNPLERERNRAQTMRNRSQKTAETLLLDPTKNKEKTCKPPGQTQEKGVWDAQQVLCPSHCETVAGKMPKRRCWNPLERRKYMPKPCETQPENCRNVAFGTYEKCRKEKNAETLHLEPTKNKKKVASSKANLCAT